VTLEKCLELLPRSAWLANNLAPKGLEWFRQQPSRKGFKELKRKASGLFPNAAQ
jgi:hypothetical protein